MAEKGTAQVVWATLSHGRPGPTHFWFARWVIGERTVEMFRSVQFTSDVGLGKVAVAAFGLGFVMAIHAAVLAYYATQVVPYVSSDRWDCVALWSGYMLGLCFFHLSEFMITAARQPSKVSYECT